MFGIDWNDQTLWLNVTNLALGVVTVAAMLMAFVAIVRELAARRRHIRDASALDDELRAMFGSESPYAMQVPGLGLTMADGGEPLKPESGGDAEPKSDSEK
jgi:hypothetical protein